MESLAHDPTLSGTAPPSASDRLEAGTSAGDYVIERFLGAGAMGEVYAGRHPVIGKRVAIKVLKRALAADPETAERFVREAKAVNQIAHENVVDIFGFGRLADGRHYLAMALIEGVSLRARLNARPLLADEALEILSAIAGALDAAHARGVVHRDLKPDNVMLGPGDKVFVLDFGIAKLVSSAEANVMTLTGQGAWLGTPGYMAPEQWSSEGAGPASDRYALGVMAFELLSGKLPFVAQSLPQMMEQHFRAPVPALSTRGATASSATFDPVLQRALAKNPDERYPSATALIEALRSAAGGKRVGGRAAHGLRSTPLNSLGSTKRSFLPAAVGAGVLGISVIGVLAVRGASRDAGDAGDTGDPGAVATSTRSVDVASEPPGAAIFVGGQQVGATPHAVDVPRDRKLTVELRKPGYLPVTKQLDAAGGAVAVPLARVSGFDGVWQLPDGRLRRFQRTGERVDAYERDAIAGRDGASHTYDFSFTEHGVMFTGAELVVDERSTDPSCRISHRVDYHYEPGTAEVLTVALERVGVGTSVDGRCAVASREPGTPVALRRVDLVANVRYSTAPIGMPQPPVTPSQNGNGKAGPRPKPSAPRPPSLAPNQAAQNVTPIPNDSMDNSLDRGVGAKSNGEAIPQVQSPTTVPQTQQAVQPSSPSSSPSSSSSPSPSSNAPPPQQQAPAQQPPPQQRQKN